MPKGGDNARRAAVSARAAYAGPWAPFWAEWRALRAEQKKYPYRVSLMWYDVEVRTVPCVDIGAACRAVALLRAQHTAALERRGGGLYLKAYKPDGVDVDCADGLTDEERDAVWEAGL